MQHKTLLGQKKKRNKVYATFKRMESYRDFEEYKERRRELKRVIRRAKRHHEMTVKVD